MGRVQEHNKEVISNAEYRATEMKLFPSKLEERMKDFLDSHWIHYEFQKIFYIYKSDGWIDKYYIADFYIPTCHTILEVDGKFHDKQKLRDKIRTRTIQENYPDVEVLRFKWKDLSDENIMNSLLYKIGV